MGLDRKKYGFILISFALPLTGPQFSSYSSFWWVFLTWNLHSAPNHWEAKATCKLMKAYIYIIVRCQPVGSHLWNIFHFYLFEFEMKIHWKINNKYSRIFWVLNCWTRAYFSDILIGNAVSKIVLLYIKTIILLTKLNKITYERYL